MADYKLDNRTQKWIKEQRGKGNGKDYHPWLTVRDLSSKGRSHCSGQVKLATGL
ncbi:hypothetical protein ACT3TA_14245 [Halomonas sp. AOP42-C1-46]|uniref:hypothetical protein n=1 Tax=Halomonas sp. AOP42-C1-46 TaxID=3457671 RepID=UPI004033A4A1